MRQGDGKIADSMISQGNMNPGTSSLSSPAQPPLTCSRAARKCGGVFTQLFH